MTPEERKDYRQLVSSITSIIDQNLEDSDFTNGKVHERNEIHVNHLLKLESELRTIISSYKSSRRFFIKFIKYITETEGNILKAQPYFREKQAHFSSIVSPAFQAEEPEPIMNSQYNYLLAKFIVFHWGEPPKAILNKFKEIELSRKLLIENNLPLAINKAINFYNSTPRSHLSLIELISISTTGLITGIDKYIGPYTKVWCSVCTHNMVGNMIEEYSKTFLRLYPKEKRLLYRINSITSKLKLDNYDDIADAVNDSLKQDIVEGRKSFKKAVTKQEVENLVNSTNYIDAQSDTDKSDELRPSIYDLTIDNDEDVEDKVIQNELKNKISYVLSGMDVIYQKLIRIKGVDL